MKLELLETNGTVKATVEDTPEGGLAYGGREPIEAELQARSYRDFLAIRRGAYTMVDGVPTLTGELPSLSDILPFMLKEYKPRKLIRQADVKRMKLDLEEKRFERRSDVDWYAVRKMSRRELEAYIDEMEDELDDADLEKLKELLKRT